MVTASVIDFFNTYLLASRTGLFGIRCHWFLFISADLRSISMVRKMHICFPITFGGPRVNGLQSFCILVSTWMMVSTTVVVFCMDVSIPLYTSFAEDMAWRAWSSQFSSILIFTNVKRSFEILFRTQMVQYHSVIFSKSGCLTLNAQTDDILELACWIIVVFFLASRFFIPYCSCKYYSRNICRYKLEM